MEFTALRSMAEAAGFTHAAPLDPALLTAKPEVREMCRANTCGQYRKRWSCPPGCGTLEACCAAMAARKSGILVQTVGELEDAFDGEGMMAAEAAHKAHFAEMHRALRAAGLAPLALGAGCCTQCEVCTYPDAPCRLPELQTVSMEAYGLVVLEVCKICGVPYYYGSERIAYTSCFLF